MKKTLPGLVVLFMLSGAVSAAEPPIQLRTSDTTQALLESYRNHPVKLKMRSGEEIGGVVAKVGDNLVHVTQVTGKEFYDAAVRIDAIDAVLVRVRER